MTTDATSHRTDHTIGRYRRLLYTHSFPLLGLGLLCLVMITATVVATQSPSPAPRTAGLTPEHHPQKVRAESAASLQELFEASRYEWPPRGQHSVPPLLLTRLPEDFDQLESPNQRRELFLRALLPIVLIENRRLREQRALAAWLLNGNLPAADSPLYAWLTGLAQHFRVRGDISQPAVRERLLGRLDVIPPALALAQAAIESGWGSSRFALQGNSLFGQWTFDDDKGLEPEQRADEATHLVASFPDLQASVRAYMRNLNTGNAYHEFRTARAASRAAGQALQAGTLATHLHRYSQRGDDYVEEIRRIIHSPSLALLADASLGQPPQTLAANSDRSHAGG
ncbi:MAG: glucosaminidase domain-containing protein [Gammaproteobacteria bacterium]|nr:glucosaminidase domain-containing protein [Gammaproteobacteria bacterium]